MASDNLAQLAARMMESIFGNHSRIPPLAPGQAPFAFVSCTRDPLLVAGRYRKLTRFVLNVKSCRQCWHRFQWLPASRVTHWTMSHELPPTSRSLSAGRALLLMQAVFLPTRS